MALKTHWKHWLSSFLIFFFFFSSLVFGTKMIQTTIQKICAVDGYKKRFLNWVNGCKLLLRFSVNTAEQQKSSLRTTTVMRAATQLLHRKRKHAKSELKEEKVLQLHIYMFLLLFAPIWFVASSTNYIMYTGCEQLLMGSVFTGKNFYFPHGTELTLCGRHLRCLAAALNICIPRYTAFPPPHFFSPHYNEELQKTSQIKVPYFTFNMGFFWD